MKKLLSILSLTLIGATAMAQSLWIQVKPTAAKGKAHKVEVCFGDKGQKFALSQWDNSMKRLDLQLISPDGSIQNLSTRQEGQDALVASFVPQQGGIYALRVVHTLPQVEHARKTTFMATSFVGVGEAEKVQQLKAGTEEMYFALNLHADAVSSAYEMQCKRGEELLTGLPIELFDQDGKFFKFETDQEGYFRWVPEESGSYQCTLNYLDQTPGNYRGQNYSNHQLINTLQLVVP